MTGGAGGIPERLAAVFGRFITDPAERAALARGEPILSAASIDSLTLVHLVAEIEKEFSVRIDYAALDDAFVDLPTLAAFLAARQGP